MKVLLDECVDRRLAREIQGHAVDTVMPALTDDIVRDTLDKTRR